MRLIALDTRALALGLEPGLTLADARARVPELVALDHDPAADLRMLEWLADACESYTPMVAIDGADAIVMDVTGCGDSVGIIGDLDVRLAGLGITARITTGSTPEATLALARHGGTDIVALPVTALRTDAETVTALRRAGLKTIGDLAARPRAPLAARFGQGLTDALDRLAGHVDRRITPRRSLPDVHVEQRFAEPVARDDDVLATLDALMYQASERLLERGEGGRRFEAALFRSDGHVARLTVETATPLRDPPVLARLLRERIGALADPLDPGFGYDLITLGVPVTEVLSAGQLQLEGGTIAEAEIAALIDRLSTRLGRARVRRLARVDTHIPEQAVLEFPTVDVRSAVWSALERNEPPARPIHLFDPPQRIEVTAGVPEDAPRRFKWRRQFHDVLHSEGPERIAAEWWCRSEGAGLSRDYYRIEDARGRRFWIFRHGLYSEKPDPAWFLHGLFA